MVWSQTWAWCNSTLWNWFERWKKDDWTNWVTSCYDYDWTDSSDIYCAVDSDIMQSDDSAKLFFDLKQTDWINQYWDMEYDTIWWKFYTWVNSSSACPTWQHVQTDEEWTTLENTLNWSVCRTWTWYQCDWLWWKNNWVNTRKLVDTLKIPLTGYRNLTYNYMIRGALTCLWTATEYESNSNLAYSRVMSSNNSTLQKAYWGKPFGFPVRCVKD